MRAPPGTRVNVRVGGVAYPTHVDEGGVQRFVANPVVTVLAEAARSRVDMNLLRTMYSAGAFSQRAYAEFHMLIGYSVCGFTELSVFDDMEIENPLWEDAP